jgi:hypothetical protein
MANVSSARASLANAPSLCHLWKDKNCDELMRVHPRPVADTDDDEM